MTFRLSVLDQSNAVSGRSPAESIRETLALAQLCERLGYHRYWVSEHHNHPAIVGTAPEILVASIAAATARIRVGPAGVMLPHYSALKVAEQFRVLEAIAPGRIDLGLGRAPGSDMRTAFALNPNADTAADQFPSQIRDLMAWVGGEELPEGHPFRGVVAHPRGPGMPEVWVLGSSDYGAQVAAYFGLPYCFAYFFADGRGAERALQLYHQQYRPSARWPKPHSAICVWALAAESEDEAQHHFTARAVWRIKRDRGVLTALPSPEEAAAEALSEPEAARLAQMRRTSLVGPPDKVGRMLRALANGLAVEEVAVVTWTHAAEVRRRSYTLLAEAFALAAAD
ncbi:MAG: LLM class flavin-dependent oxidoreductase [Alphaproteobacteria bacterium]|nr:LLM class flavin-dependent oxidoreductase [Alphaproteobacteria bacterium]